MHLRTTTLVALLLASCLTLSSPVLSAEDRGICSPLWNLITLLRIWRSPSPIFSRCWPG